MIYTIHYVATRFYEKTLNIEAEDFDEAEIKAKLSGNLTTLGRGKFLGEKIRIKEIVYEEGLDIVTQEPTKPFEILFRKDS